MKNPFPLSCRLPVLLVAVVGITSLVANGRADEAPGMIPPPRDEPKVVDPGPPPADAIVLFDGKDLSQWQSDKGDDAKWTVENGAATVNGTGSIRTKQSFGDCQLHI